MASKNKKVNPPNCYKVGDSWMIDFIYKGTRYRENIGPVSRTVAKETVAKRKAAAAEGRLDTGPKIDDLLFDKACEKYLEWYKSSRRPNSYARHVHSAIPLKGFFGGKRLSQISSFLVEKYKLDRKTACSCVTRNHDAETGRCRDCNHLADARAEATINRELTMLKHMFNRCIEWRFAKLNPLANVELFHEDNARNRYLTEAEARRLLSYCEGNLRLLVLSAMHTGFRASELRSLRWLHVDFRNCSITVESGYSKNGETRSVPMTPDLETALRSEHDKRKPAPQDAVLLSNDGTPWKDWRSAYKRALRDAGIKDFRFHDLRHCFGSYLGMNNTNPKAMMELMGHKRPEMTMRYTHLSLDYKRAAVGKLPTFGSGDMKTESPQISPAAEEAKVVNFHK